MHERIYVRAGERGGASRGEIGSSGAAAESSQRVMEQERGTSVSRSLCAALQRHAGAGGCCGSCAGCSPSGQSGHSASLSSPSLHSPNCRCRWKMQHSSSSRWAVRAWGSVGCARKQASAVQQATAPLRLLPHACPTPLDWKCPAPTHSSTSSSPQTRCPPHPPPSAHPASRQAGEGRCERAVLSSRWQPTGRLAQSRRGTARGGLPPPPWRPHLALLLLLGHQAEHQVLCIGRGRHAGVAIVWAACMRLAPTTQAPQRNERSPLFPSSPPAAPLVEAWPCCCCCCCCSFCCCCCCWAAGGCCCTTVAEPPPPLATAMVCDSSSGTVEAMSAGAWVRTGRWATLGKRGARRKRGAGGGRLGKRAVG